MMGILKKYLFQDARLKILSLVLAVMLWLAVSYMGESRMSVSVRISIENLSSDFIVSKMEPDEVLVTISGPISILKGIRTRDVRVALDMSNVNEGRQVLKLQKGNVFVTEGIKVEEVKPDYIIVETDGIVEKRLKTVVKLQRKWMGVYGIRSWDPKYVSVEGSKSSLKGKDYIETLPVDGRFLSNEEKVDVPLDMKDIVARKIKPDSIRVILKKQPAGTENIRK